METKETKQTLNVPTDLAEVALMLAGVKRMLWGISNSFTDAGTKYWKVGTDPAQIWMNDNYETVAGAVQTAASMLDIAYAALDENLI